MAYETLKCPLKRAEYLLSILNKNYKKTETITDQQILLEILEYEEILEEYSDIQEIKNLQKQILQKFPAT